MYVCKCMYVNVCLYVYVCSKMVLDWLAADSELFRLRASRVDAFSPSSCGSHWHWTGMFLRCLARAQNLGASSFLRRTSPTPLLKSFKDPSASRSTGHVSSASQKNSCATVAHFCNIAFNFAERVTTTVAWSWVVRETTFSHNGDLRDGYEFSHMISAVSREETPTWETEGQNRRTRTAQPRCGQGTTMGAKRSVCRTSRQTYQSTVSTRESWYPSPSVHLVCSSNWRSNLKRHREWNKSH